MAISPEEFQDKVKAMVRAHYAATRTPMLLAHLGSAIEKASALSKTYPPILSKTDPAILT